MVLTIGIAGGTCAGKSALAYALAAHFGDGLVLVMDDFYRQQPAAAIAAGTADFDRPEAIDFEALVAAMDQLGRGRPAEIPVYHRPTSTVTGSRLVAPAPVLIVEGLYVLNDERIRNLLALSVFIEIDAERQLSRRLERDVAGYGRDEDRVRRNHAIRIVPSEARYLAPARVFADVILPPSQSVQARLDICLAALHKAAGS